MSEINSSAVGITEEMRVAAIEAAKADPEIRTMAGRGAGVFHALPSIVDVALRAALTGRTVIDESNLTAWHLQPDDVVLIGNVTGHSRVEEFIERLRELWPDRKFVLFADDIDIALLRDGKLASGSSKGGDPRE